MSGREITINAPPVLHVPNGDEFAPPEQHAEVRPATVSAPDRRANRETELIQFGPERP